MNILFMTLVDFDSIEKRGIYTDLVREFVRNGHMVYVISPVEKSKKQSSKLISSKSHKILKLRIDVIQKNNVLKKGIATLLIESRYVNAIKRYFSKVKFDLVLYATPPITFYKAIAYVKKRDHSKTYLMLKDIFPQNAVDIGMMKKTGIKGLIYRYFRTKEKKLYAISDYIGCMSQANVDYVRKNNPDIPANCVEICPNSIHPISVDIDEEQKRTIKSMYNIPFNRTVFIYGGNLGKPQGIDFLIKCLKTNMDDERVFFVIVGSGTEFNKLNAFIHNEKPKNVINYAQMPKDEYDILVSSCDVGLLFLDKRFTIPNFPSKMLSYMQVSMPVLAATDVSTDVKDVIAGGGFGLWCKSDDVEGFKQKLHQLYDEDLRNQMGQKARSYLEDNYTVKRSYEIIMNHFIQEKEIKPSCLKIKPY